MAATMKYLQKTLNFLCDEDGPTTVEYAVMLMAICAVVVGTVQLLGLETQDNLENSRDKIADAMGN
jgi:pilus assembly protein Flp/PilA